jgi:hypothetical protein
LDGMGRAVLAAQLFSNRLDIADQEIVVDLFVSSNPPPSSRESVFALNFRAERDKAPDPSCSLELVNDSAGNEAGRWTINQRSPRAGNFVSWRLFQLRVESREHGEAHGQNTGTGRDCRRVSW